MKILFFNGPPRSGKDTAALHLYHNYGYVHFDRFAMPCKLSFAGIVQADESDVDDFGNVQPYEKTKEDVISWLGVSYRQYQIDFSEKFLKPQYGGDIFARLFIQRTKQLENSMAQAIVVPDSGFESEVAPVVNAFGEDNVILFRIYRPGCTFKGDSRSYLPDGLIKNTIDVVNDSTIEDFHKKIDDLTRKFLNLE